MPPQGLKGDPGDTQLGQTGSDPHCGARSVVARGQSTVKPDKCRHVSRTALLARAGPLQTRGHQQQVERFVRHFLLVGVNPAILGDVAANEQPESLSPGSENGAAVRIPE